MFRHLNEKIKKIFVDARITYGFEHQMRMHFEESSEANVEINKWLRYRSNINKLAEELADERLTSDQIIFNLHIEDLVENYYYLKLDRLKGRIEREKFYKEIEDLCDRVKE